MPVKGSRRYDIIRCSGEVERASGIRFVLVDKRTALVIATTTAKTRKPLYEFVRKLTTVSS